MAEDFVGEIGKKKMREAGEPCPGLGVGNRLADKAPADTRKSITGDEALLDGEDRRGGEMAGTSLRDQRI